MRGREADRLFSAGVSHFSNRAGFEFEANSKGV
jgi:hypothetical protein